MSINLAETEGNPLAASQLPMVDDAARAELLTNSSEAETLAFLAQRPLHTVCLAGLILENGLVSILNRGAFYASRDANREIDGIALIGHATLIETNSDTALRAFARMAQRNSRAHLIRGEKEIIERFWNYYMPVGSAPHRVCREILFEQRESSPPKAPVADLRPATLDDLGPVIAINAEMIYEESGASPLDNDLSGFRRRTAHRIEQNRIWVWSDHGRLRFKTDVMAATPDVIYLEGVYVSPEDRGKGYGLRCLSQLSRHLLQETKSICLLVNERNRAAINFYTRAGFTMHGFYDTIYLKSSGE